MDIKQNCVLSPIFPLEIDPHNFSPIMNLYTPDKTECESSFETEDEFRNTYSSLQTILSQMQLKLSSVFLQEVQYLKQHEQNIEYEEKNLKISLNKIQYIQNQRKQIEKDFLQLKDRLETTIHQVSKFYTDGAQLLQTLFSKSHQIDEQLSGLICESLASLSRSRTMIDSKRNDFLQKSDHIQSELTKRQVLTDNTQSSIALMIELVNTLNQLNIDYSQDLTTSTIDIQNQYREFNDKLVTTNIHWDIEKEMNEIHLLEKEKIQLENDLIQQTSLLENINTILGSKT